MNQTEVADDILRNARILGFSEGVVHMELRDEELRFRFWPKPFMEFRPTERAQDDWQSDDWPGETLLRRAHSFALRPSPAQLTYLTFDHLDESRIAGWQLDCVLAMAFAEIPFSVRESLGLRFQRWSLLELAAHSNEVEDLMSSNPMFLSLWLDEVLGKSSLTEALKITPLQTPSA